MEDTNNFFYKKVGQFVDEAMKDSKNVIVLTDAEVERARKFSIDCEKYKHNEAVYINDGHNICGRSFVGRLGEMAVEKYLQYQFIDWTIGDSKDYNIPDILPYNTGVKSASHGYCPAVPFRNTYNQIICVVGNDKNDKHYVTICGLASRNDLNRYQSIYNVSHQLEEKRKKAGFYGFNRLHKFTSLDDLTKYNNEFVVNENYFAMPKYSCNITSYYNTKEGTVYKHPYIQINEFGCSSYHGAEHNKSKNIEI